MFDLKPQPARRNAQYLREAIEPGYNRFTKLQGIWLKKQTSTKLAEIFVLQIGYCFPENTFSLIVVNLYTLYILYT